MKTKYKSLLSLILQQFDNPEIKKNVENYLIDTFDKADLHDVTVNLSSNRTVEEGGVECNGFFEADDEDENDEPTLAVAIGQPFERWFPVFVHEACHMDQWIEQHHTWNASHSKLIDSLDLLSLWFEHKIELTHEQFMKWVKVSRDCELDCERRAVKIIKKYNLPLDPIQYTKRANSYIFFYTLMWYTRNWYIPNKEPYNVPEFVDIMPEHFDNDYDNVPEHIKLLWIRKNVENTK